jgi:nucleotide-binding universal stress UspA family protein
MSAYQTVLVGTDGSDSSLRAVDRAADIAARSSAKVIVATAYLPPSDPRFAHSLKDESYKSRAQPPSMRSYGRPGIGRRPPEPPTSRRSRSSE